MKYLFNIGITIICIALGIVIGRTNLSPKDNEGNQFTKEDPRASQSRSPKQEVTKPNKNRGSARPGSSTSTSYKDSIAHIKAFAQKAGSNPQIPNFDALFGIWKTAHKMNAAEILQALNDLNNDSLNMQGHMMIHGMLVMQLAKKNGPEAMGYTMDLEKNNEMILIKKIALQAWSNNDPEGAYTWYLNNKDVLTPRDSKQFLAGTIEGLAKKDFTSALEIAKNVDDLSRGSVLLNMGAVIADNPEHRKQFTDYLLTLENSDERNKIASVLVRKLTLTNLQAAIEYVEAWQVDGKTNLVNSLASEWVRAEPEKALDWQLSQTGAEGSIGLSNSFRGWARQNVDAARKWLNAQEENLNKDQLRRFAAKETIWHRNSAEAVQWASSIQDPEQKTKSYTEIYATWSGRDYEGATKWVETLDEATRKAVVTRRANQ